MTDTWRLFIALPLPDSVIAVLEETQRALKKTASQRAVTWVAPRNIHLTLKFLGETPISQRDGIAEALARVATQHDAFSLSTAHLGCFPDHRSPRVVWVGLAGDQAALRRLQESVERAIAPLGYPAENRPFSPHLTLGRVRRDVRREDAQRLGAVVRKAVLSGEASWLVTELVLFRSELRPEGADYTKLSSAPLQDAR
ncbi:MAG: RNA 2',3'-cyclic phosphodiesterase [Anaerolineae bacterium]|nr:RNA 2',3'-cyclic phosphodiesterase [Anaerolineae bacterium]